MKTTLSFYECEHNDDLDTYIHDIRACGGRVIASTINTDEEVGTVLLEHTEDFWNLFKKTDSYEFLT